MTLIICAFLLYSSFSRAKAVKFLILETPLISRPSTTHGGNFSASTCFLYKIFPFEEKVNLTGLFYLMLKLKLIFLPPCDFTSFAIRSFSNSSASCIFRRYSFLLVTRFRKFLKSFSLRLSSKVKLV